MTLGRKSGVLRDRRLTGLGPFADVAIATKTMENRGGMLIAEPHRDLQQLRDTGMTMTKRIVEVTTVLAVAVITLACDPSNAQTKNETEVTPGENNAVVLYRL